MDTLSIQQRHARPPSWLSSARETVDRKTGEIKLLTAYVDGFRLSYDPAGVLQARGSLPKYWRGSNIDMLTRKEIEAAVSKLSDVAGFDPLFTRVFQMDLAATMPMPRPVAQYLLVLGSAPRFKRISYGSESVRFQNKSRSFFCYDKGKQSGIDEHLLRFEVKYKKNLKRYFDRPVFLVDLYDPVFYRLMVERWQEAYALVRKVKRPVLVTPTSPRDLERQLAQAGLPVFGGVGYVKQMLPRWVSDRKKRYRYSALPLCLY